MKKHFGNARGKERGGGLFFFTKAEIPERCRVLSEIPSLVAVKISSGIINRPLAA